MVRRSSKTGRFTKGNKGGPGRPRVWRRSHLHAALTKQLTLEDWSLICARAVRDARGGSASARSFLLHVLLVDLSHDLDLPSRLYRELGPDHPIRWDFTV